MNGDELRDAGQAQAESALPSHTREHLRAIAMEIVNSNQPFTFPETDSGCRSVAAEVAPMDRAIADKHGGVWGSLTTALLRGGVIMHVGRAKTLDSHKRRYVGIYQKVA